MVVQYKAPDFLYNTFGILYRHGKLDLLRARIVGERFADSALLTIMKTGILVLGARMAFLTMTYKVEKV